MPGDLEQEGWYTDPYGRHDARWISGGIPTKLCRDGDTESYDAPPDSPPSHAWVPIAPPPGSATAADTLRADSAEAEMLPSLDELSRKEMSVAITTEAHPWFVARHWIPSSTPGKPPSRAKPLSAARRSALIAGGVVAGSILLLSIYLWAVQVVDALSPPPLWGEAVVASLGVLVPPAVPSLIWRGDRRAGLPLAVRVQRAEIIAGLVGLLSLLILACALSFG